MSEMNPICNLKIFEVHISQSRFKWKFSIREQLVWELFTNDEITIAAEIKVHNIAEFYSYSRVRNVLYSSGWWPYRLIELWHSVSPFLWKKSVKNASSNLYVFFKCHFFFLSFVWFVFGFPLFFFLVSFRFLLFNFRTTPKEKFRREFGIAMKCCSADEDRRRRQQNRTANNLSPSPSVVTSLTRTPKQQHHQRQSQLGLFGSSQQPRRSSTKSGTSSPIFKGKNGSSPSEAETILLCTMNSSVYTHVSTVDE